MERLWVDRDSQLFSCLFAGLSFFYLLCGMKRLVCVLYIIMCVTSLPLHAQRPAYAKMSPLVRRLAMQQMVSQRSASAKEFTSGSGKDRKHRTGEPRLCAFLQLDDDSEAVFRDYDCKPLARFGRIYIADIPVSRLPVLSLDPHVLRIEGNQHSSIQMDSTAACVNAFPVYSGLGLPQAYTGKGVVVGVQDIGFDLTHPDFYDSSATRYRIRAMWDQLSTDTVGSSSYVGNDYVGQEALLGYAHSRDGLDQTHGTHTAGIAAGSGYISPYRGMAYESDICLVANASSEDVALIDTADYYKYTYATDALGFKYIFDYADKVSKPCVINFSEGSMQDFRGDDLLYYAILDSLTGKGHILVSSAGNTGAGKVYIHKPEGKDRAGTFVNSEKNYVYHTLKSAQPFTIRIKFYTGDTPIVVEIPTTDVLGQADSILVDTLDAGGQQYVINIIGYPSCYNQREMVYDVQMKSGESQFGNQVAVSMEMVGREADVECYRGSGNFFESSLDPTLTDGESSYGINSPGSAPCVISVGATSYRTQIVNYQGEKKVYNQGTDGVRADYSSIGPTFDGRTKPDVMAPGTNIISSYSSFYLANHPDANDIGWDVAHFDFKGRTYAWNTNSGTSMASPVVAGAIALWLEADPQLSPADCMDIFRATCTHPDPSLSYPNNLYGYGQIDVYAGLTEVLKRKATGLKDISSVHPEGIRYTYASGVLGLFMDEPSAKNLSVRIYTVDGILRKQLSLPAGKHSYEVDLRGFRPGVYIVQIAGLRQFMIYKGVG